MTTTFRVQIASLPDREEVVAEIWSGEEQVAGLRMESGVPRIQIYSPRESDWWDFPYSALSAALEQAFRRLTCD